MSLGTIKVLSHAYECETCTRKHSFNYDRGQVESDWCVRHTLVRIIGKLPLGATYRLVRMNGEELEL